MGIIRGLTVGIITENYEWELSAKITTLYINDAEKMRFIGILAYPKSKKTEDFTINIIIPKF